MEVSGDATPVIEEVLSNPGVGLADYSVSANGVLAFRSSSNRSYQFASFDRTGKRSKPSVLLAITERRTFLLMASGLSTATSTAGHLDLDLARRTSSRFTSGAGTENPPVWFPEAPRSRIGPTSVDSSKRMSPAPGPSGFFSKQPVNGPDQVSADGKWILSLSDTRRKPGRVRGAD